VQLTGKMKESIFIDYYGKHKLFVNCVLVVLIAVAARIILGSCYFSITATHFDSQDYLRAATMLNTFYIHSSRLLIYPLIILISKHLFFFLDTNNAILLFQSLLGVASTVFIYLIALNVFNRSKLALIIGIFCATNPYIINWEHCVLTECTTFFLTTLLLFAFVNYTRDFNVRYGSLMYITLIIAAFCKLLFLYFVVPLFIGLLIYSKFSGHIKKVLHLGLIFIPVLIASATLFRYINYKQNGINTFAETSEVLKYVKVYEYKLYRLNQENGISKYMEKASLEQWGTWEVYDKHLKIESKQHLYSFFPSLFRYDPVHFTIYYLKGSLNKIICAFKSPVAVYYCNRSASINDADPFNYISIFVILLLTLVDMVLNFISLLKGKFDRNCFTWLFVDLVIVYVFFLMTFGSFAEFGRCFYPAYLFLVLLVFKFLIISINGILTFENNENNKKDV
jgi:4-amino-4-deoxy-L-arabinose transferase-like glycosyltransferase